MVGMRFGVSLGAAGAGRDPRGMIELAQAAEAAGWDGLFLEDYLVYQGDPTVPTYDPWVTLGVVAAATTRLRLGTTVTALPRRRPWKLAAEAVTVDHASGGRLILGVGAGDVVDPSFAAVGEPGDARTRAELLDEGLHVLDALWSGMPVTHHGQHHRVDGLRLAATPLQQPRIPIWVGGDWLVPGVRRRVVRWDGACVYKGPPGAGLQMTADDVAAIHSAVREARGEHAARSFDIKVGGSRDRGWLRECAAAGATWWNQWLAPGDPDDTLALIAAGPPKLD